jgi:hypothetical protein
MKQLICCVVSYLCQCNSSRGPTSSLSRVPPVFALPVSLFGTVSVDVACEKSEDHYQSMYSHESHYLSTRLHIESHQHLCACTCMLVRRYMLPARTQKQNEASSMHTTCEHHGSPMQQSQTSFLSSFSSAVPSSWPPLVRNSQESPDHLLSKLSLPPFSTATA